MRKSCELDDPVLLPPIGTRVVIVDGGPTGTVTGYGTSTRAGFVPGPEIPLVPVVIVQLDEGFYPPSDRFHDCWISSITVHPDNLELHS